MVFPELLGNKSFGYFRQFHNSNLPEMMGEGINPCVLVNEFEYTWHLNSQESVTYNWEYKTLTMRMGTEAKQLKFKSTPSWNLLLSPNKKMMVETLFIGQIKSGKYHSHGYYMDIQGVYEGEFLNGLRHGYGKYHSDD